MNGISDFSPLSGDPMATETIDDWAADMTKQLLKVSADRRRTLILDMTDEERDILAQWCGTGTREELAS